LKAYLQTDHGEHDDRHGRQRHVGRAVPFVRQARRFVKEIVPAHRKHHPRPGVHA